MHGAAGRSSKKTKRAIMVTYILRFLVFGILAEAGVQGSQCTFHSEVVAVNETDPPGYEILNLTADSNTTWQLEEVVGLHDYLALEQRTNSSDYVLRINRTLDLENLNMSVNSLTLRLICHEEQDVSYQQNLIINPVNEYAPEFVDAPFSFNISESTAPGYVLTTLENKAQDRDFNPTTREIQMFSLDRFTKPGDGDSYIDGYSYFNMSHVVSGQIVLGRSLDYEWLEANNQTNMWLNISVRDTGGKRTWSTIHVTIQDADDLPPEFYHESCPVTPLTNSPCFVAYSAEIAVNTKGNITHILPASIFARDRDTLGSPVTYQLTYSPDSTWLSSHFDLNNSTAELTVTEVFPETGIFTLFIIAQEESVNRLTAQTTLQIAVRELVDPNLINTDANAQDDMEMLAIIGMSVLGAIVFFLAVALFVVSMSLRKFINRHSEKDDCESESESDMNMSDVDKAGHVTSDKTEISVSNNDERHSNEDGNSSHKEGHNNFSYERGHYSSEELWKSSSIVGHESTNVNSLVSGEDIPSPHESTNVNSLVSGEDIPSPHECTNVNSLVSGEDIPSPHESTNVNSLVSGEDIPSPHESTNVNSLVSGEDIPSPHESLSRGHKSVTFTQL